MPTVGARRNGSLIHVARGHGRALARRAGPPADGDLRTKSNRRARRARPRRAAGRASALDHLVLARRGSWSGSCQARARSPFWPDARWHWPPIASAPYRSAGPALTFTWGIFTISRPSSTRSPARPNRRFRLVYRFATIRLLYLYR